MTKERGRTTTQHSNEAICISTADERYGVTARLTSSARAEGPHAERGKESANVKGEKANEETYRR